MTSASTEQQRRPKIGRYAVIAILFVLLCWKCAFSGDGPRRILNTACSDGGSIDLALSVYPHTLDFELGGSVGYEVTYRTKAGDVIPLYDDNFSSQDRHGVVTAPFVSWRFDGNHFSGPYPSYTYAPLPRTGPVRVFNKEAQVGYIPKPSNLNFMNMFLDPRRVTMPQFLTVADCLAAHKEEFDRALVDMQNDIPSNLGKFYHPLRLGGVFYGPPPYTDPTYMKGVEDLLSASVIPGAGGFRLFRGRTATGVINGHQVELSLSNAGEIEVQRDGMRVNFDAKGKGNHPGVSRSGWSFYFDADGCPDQQGYCGELIEMIGQRDDLSDWFLIFRQLGPAAWGQTQVPSPFQP
jgi:hypothetical protein